MLFLFRSLNCRLAGRIHFSQPWPDPSRFDVEEDRSGCKRLGRRNGTGFSRLYLACKSLEPGARGAGSMMRPRSAASIIEVGTAPEMSKRERILIKLMTSDRKLKASREGSKSRMYGTQKTLTIHDVKSKPSY